MSKHYQGSAVTNTTAQHFIPEIWADGIYKYFERKSLFVVQLMTIQHYFQEKAMEMFFIYLK